MPKIDSVTFIYDDGSTTEAPGGNVSYDHYGNPRVIIPLAFTPQQETHGMDVVAAYDDGSVECAFTVGHIARSTDNIDGDRQRVYAPSSAHRRSSPTP